MSHSDSDSKNTPSSWEPLVDEFDRLWQTALKGNGARPRLPELLARVPEKSQAQLLSLLAPIERECRGQLGEVLQPERDYPELSAEQRQQLAQLCAAPPEAETLPPQKPGAAPRGATQRTAVSQTIGPYKLLQKLGEGGMGEVWMAEQSEPVRRRVALKLIKAGLDNKQVLARFEAERQALALMDHQNIARVLDAGATPEGSPYFVMELVQGIPFNQYCDQHKLSIDQRLELFLPVCAAVQHAHQKGIIHRDLKPSNVLVCLYDGKPVPKVIDFGLAKALQATTKLTDKTMFTEFGQVVGTLQYMSPEQAEMNQLDIDTRTDIYSLGVMLYELLTGSTPIDQETMRRQAILQVLEAIRVQEPPRPSARLSSATQEAASGVSQQRQIEPSRLKSLLKGELDWIVMKALEKDRTRRYETASSFGDDIQRYLSGDVVTARPPSTSYRLAKYVRRHKGLVASLASIAALLVAGIAGTSVGLYRADAARKLADLKASEVAQEKRKVELEKEKVESARDEAVKAKQAESEALQAETTAREKTQAALEQSEATLARSNYYLATARWMENRPREALKLLQSIPEKLRYFEWYLDARFFLGSEVTLYDANWVKSVAFSPDGTRIASVSEDNTLKLWDAATGRELGSLQGHTDFILSVAFSPDGSRIVSGSFDKTLKLWDAASGKELRTLKGHTDSVSSVAFSRDGLLIVSGSFDKTLKLWDVASGKELRTLKGHTDSVSCVAFSPDGMRIVSGCWDQTLKLWDTASGSDLRTLQGHSKVVQSVAFSPDGTRIVSGSGDRTLKQWDAASGSELRTLEGHTDWISSVAFSPDGTRIVSGSWDNTLKLWDAATGSELRTLQGHTAQVISLAFSPDGSRIVSGSGDNTLKLWDAVTWSEPRILQGHIDRLTSVAFSPNGARIVSGSEDNTLKLWDAATGSELRTLQGHVDWVSSVAFSSDGRRIVSASGDKTIKLWDAVTGSELRTLQGHVGPVVSVAFSPDGRQIVSGSEDKTLKLWDAVNGSELRTLQGHTDKLTSVAFSPDGTRIVSGSSDQTLKLWDAASGSELRTLEGHTSWVTSVAFRPDGTQIVSGSGDRTLKLWDPATGSELHTLQGHTDEVMSVAYSPDGRRIVSGSWDKTLKLWDAATGSELRTLQGNNHLVISVAFSPDGARIASGGWDRTLKLWDAATGTEQRKLQGHIDLVSSVAFSPDGTRIVSGSADKKIKLWDPVTGSELRTLHGHTDQVISVAFSPDGTRIFSRDAKNKTLVWDSQTGNLSDESATDFADTSSTKSPDGRWLIVPTGSDVGIVDLALLNSPQEKAYREFYARPKPWWHREQAELYSSQGNWYVACFHWAWVLKTAPDDAETFDSLHAAHDKWLAQLKMEESEFVQAKESYPEPDAYNQLAAQRQLTSGPTPVSPEQLLAPVVLEMLKLPRGEKSPTPRE